MTSTTPAREARKSTAGTVEVGDVVATTRKAIVEGAGQQVREIEKAERTVRFIDAGGQSIMRPALTTEVWLQVPSADDGHLPESGPDSDTRIEEAASENPRGDAESDEQRIYALVKASAERLGLRSTEDDFAAVTDKALQLGYASHDDIDLDVILGGMLAEGLREPEEPPISLRGMLIGAGLPRAGAATVDKALEELEVDGAAEPTPEQKDRLGKRMRGKAKAGLSAKAAVLWIISGEDSKAQAERARLAEERKGAGSPSRATGRASTGDGSARGPREGSTLWAVLKVLTEKAEAMRPEEVYAEIKANRLAPGLKGKTPEATVAAQMAVAAKRGKHGIFRPEKGRYAVKAGA